MKDAWEKIARGILTVLEHLKCLKDTEVFTRDIVTMQTLKARKQFQSRESGIACGISWSWIEIQWRNSNTRSTKSRT